MPRELKLYPYVIARIGLTSCAVLAVSLAQTTILIGCAVLTSGILLRLGFHAGRSEKGK
jgi:hypothetical protein